jgi:glycerophosphoryl diester phosphodiesterase
VEDLLAATPRDVVLQLEVKAHVDPALAGRTVDALAERQGGRTRGRRIEVLSFTAAACARAAELGCPARLAVWVDYAPAALVRWARRYGVGGLCVEHFLLSPPLMDTLRRGGLSVTTGTLNEPALVDRVLSLRPDAVTSDRPRALREAAVGVPSLAA